MNTKVLLEYANFLDLILCVGILAIMWKRRVLTAFSMLAFFLTAESANELITIPIMFFRKNTGLSREAAWSLLVYSHWFFFVVESVLILGIIYSVFRKAMQPLVGLHSIGKIIFRWVAGVSVAVSLCVSVGPCMFAASHSVTFLSFAFISGQVQQAVSILTLCLLLFVCFSVKPLGLTYRSHIFGVSLGLGVFAAVELAVTAWYAPAQNVYSTVNLVSCLGTCVGFAVWGGYFAMPEPARRMILLPTTSPYFLWNRISEALGDEPGDVAIAGFKPEMLAPAELRVMTAMSRAAREREARMTDHESVPLSMAR